MMIKESMNVFWQSLKDVWEELYSLAIVNLVWVFSFLPILLLGVSTSPAVALPAIVVALALASCATAGIYWVAHRVAQGKTFHFADFLAGVKLLWWRALLWVLANIVVIVLVILNLNFYPQILVNASPWIVIAIGGLWLAVLMVWTTMQLYFWPLLIYNERHSMLMAWRNSAYLLMANPFYAFFNASFTLVLLALSLVLTLPFIFVGVALVAVLGSNAVQIALVKFGAIEDPRPKPIRRA